MVNKHHLLGPCQHMDLADWFTSGFTSGTSKIIKTTVLSPRLIGQVNTTQCFSAVGHISPGKPIKERVTLSMR